MNWSRCIFLKYFRDFSSPSQKDTLLAYFTTLTECLYTLGQLKLYENGGLGEKKNFFVAISNIWGGGGEIHARVFLP